MIVSIHQPEHLPWAGLIHKIAISDIYVVLDNVQFKKNYFENRNKIYSTLGWQWLTVPVKMKGHIEKKFYEIEIMGDWKKKYINTLKLNYLKAPFLKDIESTIDVIENYSGDSLADLNIIIINEFCKILNIKTKIIRASEMTVHGSKSELLIDILKQVGATEYIVGKSGFDYMNLDLFKQNNIILTAHSFKHPIYKPFNSPEFTDFPSIIDVLANLGTLTVEKCIYENDAT